MTQYEPQNLDINAMRQKLRDSRTTDPQRQKPSNQSYIPPSQNQQFQAPPTKNPHIQRQSSIGDRLEQQKALFTHIHNYWHYYLTAMTFLLFHTMGAFPQAFPGTGNMESLYGHAPGIAFFFLTLPSIFVFFVVSSLKRSLQNAARITESKNWSQLEWIGAAIGFALLFYWVFIKADPLEQFMVEDAIKGPFELTPREWIMAGVKCVGGAVTGAILARKFFGDYREE